MPRGAHAEEDPMNKIGKWTGIALLGASVIAFDVLALTVGVNAAREFRSSPEAHAVGVASRIVARAVVRQVVGGATRAADQLNWAGLRGAPEAIAAIAAVGDPDPNGELRLYPAATTGGCGTAWVGVCRDREVTRIIRQARRHVEQAQVELRSEAFRARLEAEINAAMAREKVRIADRERVRVHVREVIARLAAGDQTI
jgi:hypothetical protein